MFGVTPMSQSQANGVLTISTREGQVFEFVKPNRMDSLPNDLIKAIFIRLITIYDLLAFSETCKRAYTISCELPVYAFTSEPLCRLIFMRNMEIKSAAVQLTCEVISEPETSYSYADRNLLSCNPSAKLQKAQDIFYITFTRCCFQPNTPIDCREFFNHFKTAFLCIRKNYKKDYFPEGHEEIKSKTLCAFIRLKERIYQDIINISTNQLIESVTFNSIKGSSAEIKALFPGRSEIDIEADLRNALRAKYGTVFKTYAAQSLNAFPCSAIVTEMELQLRAPLEAQKSAIEAELAILCGPNGTINAASIKMEALMHMQDEPVDQAMLNAAFAVYQKTQQQEVRYDSRAVSTPSNNLKNARAKLREAMKSPTVHEREAAKAKFDALVARSNTLAQWEEGTNILIGGKLLEICNKLENIGFTALFKVRQRGEFFAELACPVTEENKQVRFDFLLKCANS